MPALVFDKCCGCIELRVGCLIIGYLQLVANIIWFVMLLFGVAAGAAAANSALDPNDQKLGTFLAIICGIMLIFVGVALIFVLLLLIGIHKEKRNCVKAYLIYSVIFAAIGLLMAFVSFGNQSANVGGIVSQIISTFIYVYFILVIRSYYLQMCETQQANYDNI